MPWVCSVVDDEVLRVADGGTCTGCDCCCLVYILVVGEASVVTDVVSRGQTYIQRNTSGQTSIEKVCAVEFQLFQMSREPFLTRFGGIKNESTITACWLI